MFALIMLFLILGGGVVAIVAIATLTALKLIFSIALLPLRLLFLPLKLLLLPLIVIAVVIKFALLLAFGTVVVALLIPLAVLAFVLLAPIALAASVFT